ncbi:hypothetical protein [Microbacterium excoecariae]|uniref:hypothetical protein n=1 Tax=Microbacterium excoecariae TaxID=2715210 RepID=UPI00140B9605|nr:hypothetical protein [Microbacterium excoecariae]NHI17470.1 hypothetical protein [Microbacterium excoecariae]
MTFWRKWRRAEPEAAPAEPQAAAPQTTLVPEIVLLSAPRSGTNFFCECLVDLPEIMGLYEIFNRGGVYGADRGNQLAILSEVSGVEASAASDPELVALFREHPLEALRALRETAERVGQSVVSYKIFPNQLSDEALERILADDHRIPLILVRSRLDVFVSYEKARQSKTWKNADTSAMRPTIDVDEFVEWARGNDAWFTSLADTLDRLGRPYRMLSYAEDVDVPKPQLIADLHATLVEDGVAVSLPAKSPGVRFQRQDVVAEPFAKVAGGEELRAELVARGLLDYALGEPLSGRGGRHGLVAATGGDTAS